MTNILLQKTLAESNGEKKLEIDQHLTKLLTKNVVGLFMAHTVLSLLLLRCDNADSEFIADYPRQVECSFNISCNKFYFHVIHVRSNHV